MSCVRVPCRIERTQRGGRGRASVSAWRAAMSSCNEKLIGGGAVAVSGGKEKRP